MMELPSSLECVILGMLRVHQFCDSSTNQMHICDLEEYWHGNDGAGILTTLTIIKFIYVYILRCFNSECYLKVVWACANMVQEKLAIHVLLHSKSFNLPAQSFCLPTLADSIICFINTCKFYAQGVCLCMLNLLQPDIGVFFPCSLYSRKFVYWLCFISIFMFILII